MNKKKYYEELGWNIFKDTARKKSGDRTISIGIDPHLVENKEFILYAGYNHMWFDCGHIEFLYVLMDIMEQIIRNNKIEEMIEFMRDFSGHGCGWKTVSSPDINRLLNSLLSEGVY